MTSNYSYMRWHQHLVDSVKPPWRFIGSSFAVFATLWTIIEATSFFENEDSFGVRNGDFYFYLVCFSVLFGFVHSFLVYWRSTPAFAEGLPKEAQHLIRVRPKGWEFQLAQTLLVKAIVPLDQRLHRVVAGEAFVPLRSEAGIEAYFGMIKVRMNNLTRMIRSTECIISTGFPRCFAGEMSVEERTRSIQTSVTELEELYKTTIAFEEELHSMQIPEGFEKLHEIQSNWSEEIRQPLQKLLIALQEIRSAIEIKVAKDKVDYSIEIKPPANINAFMVELAQLQSEGFVNRKV